MRSSGYSALSVILTIVLTMFLAAPAAEAATITFADCITLTATDWSSSLTIPKFNPALGTLTGIKFTLTGHVEANTKIENLDATTQTLSSNVQGNITLTRPDLSVIVVSLPGAVASDLVGPYDNVTDFLGADSASHSLSNDCTTIKTSPPPASDLTLFSGAGNIVLPVTASATSFGSGGGNLNFHADTKASALATVEYTYTTIPEPATLALMGTSAIGLIGWRRRRRS